LSSVRLVTAPAAESDMTAIAAAIDTIGFNMVVVVGTVYGKKWGTAAGRRSRITISAMFRV